MVLQKDSLLQFCILFPDCMNTEACTVPRMIMLLCFICILPLKAPKRVKCKNVLHYQVGNEANWLVD